MKKTQHIRELETPALKCRAWKHAWEHEVTFLISATSRRQTLELRLKCLRCPTKRTDTLTNGRIERRRYTYPDGYLLEHVSRNGKHSRANQNASVRKTLVGRLPKPKRLAA